MALERNQWLGIGILAGMAYLFGKKKNPFEAEEYEGCQHEWRTVRYGKHPTKRSQVWLCKGCNAEIDSITKPSQNRKIRPNSYTKNWRMPKQSHYFGAESFGAEDSRRRLKVLMEGKSKEERKRISKMVQVRGLENTIAELMANAEAFAATTFDEDDDDSPKINRDEWVPRTDCEICARPVTINRFGQQLIQHYLKESDNGEKAWKSKKNTDGVRRTARNLAGFFLYEYGLDALNQYVLFQDKTGISDKVIELLRLSLVERVIAGDVVNLIEMMDMGDEVDGEPMFGKKFEDDFGSEGNEGVFI